MPSDGSFTSLEPHTKEDFQKMLTEWQEHLGSLQVNDRAVLFFFMMEKENVKVRHISRSLLPSFIRNVRFMVLHLCAYIPLMTFEPVAGLH
jgi:hypothetical protein